MPADTVDVVGKRLTAHGYHLTYMTMDEPVWFAHEVSWGKENGTTPCHYSLPRLVERVALTLKHLKRYFSDLQIGETEVVGDFADHHLHRAAVLRDYVQFTGMLERATGIKLAYWHCDIAWRTDWRPDIAPLARAFRSRGIRFGAIIGGTPLDATDQAFVEAGLARLRELQANPATRLDDIVVQSWQPRPSKFLPETEPGTMTNLLLRAEGVGRQTASPPVPPKEASR